jgi:hypothetical protein
MIDRCAGVRRRRPEPAAMEIAVMEITVMEIAGAGIVGVEIRHPTPSRAGVRSRVQMPGFRSDLTRD